MSGANILFSRGAAGYLLDGKGSTRVVQKSIPKRLPPAAVPVGALQSPSQQPSQQRLPSRDQLILMLRSDAINPARRCAYLTDSLLGPRLKPAEKAEVLAACDKATVCGAFNHILGRGDLTPAQKAEKVWSCPAQVRSLIWADLLAHRKLDRSGKIEILNAAFKQGVGLDDAFEIFTAIDPLEKGTADERVDMRGRALRGAPEALKCLNDLYGACDAHGRPIHDDFARIKAIAAGSDVTQGRALAGVQVHALRAATKAIVESPILLTPYKIQLLTEGLGDCAAKSKRHDGHDGHQGAERLEALVKGLMDSDLEGGGPAVVEILKEATAEQTRVAIETRAAIGKLFGGSFDTACDSIASHVDWRRHA